MKSWKELAEEYEGELMALMLRLEEVRGGARDTWYPRRVGLLEQEIVELRAAVRALREKAEREELGALRLSISSQRKEGVMKKAYQEKGVAGYTETCGGKCTGTGEWHDYGQ